MSKSWNDFTRSLGLWEIWSYLAIDDVLARYKRTMLGPLWNTAYIVFTSISLSIVFGALFVQPISQTLPYILSGMIAWNLVALQVLDSAALFTIYAGTIKVSSFPLFFYVMRNVTRNFLFFLHNLVAFLVICPIVGHLPIMSVTVIPGLILGVLISIPFSMLTGMAGARYRDLLQLFTNLTGLFFFITPIFWRPDGITGPRRLILQYNPFYYVIELVRLPFLGLVPGLEIWFGSLIILAAGLFLCAIVFTRFRSRVPYWV